MQAQCVRKAPSSLLCVCEWRRVQADPWLGVEAGSLQAIYPLTHNHHHHHNDSESQSTCEMDELMRVSRDE